MRNTVQIRISTESHAILKDMTKRGMTISRLGDKAVFLLKKEIEKNTLEYEKKIAILYPNREIKNGHNVSKTQRLPELSTLSKDLKSGKIWTYLDLPSDNDNETKI